MTAREKMSAVGALAHDLAREMGQEKGSEVAHTGARPGEIAGEAVGDLFREFGDDLQAFEGHAIAPPAQRRPGRPPGSTKKTQQLSAWLAAKGYRDPLEFLAALYSADAKQLAEALECEPVEVVRLQEKAATNALPYTHQKLPMQVEHMSAELRPLFVIGDIAGGGSAADSRFMSAIEDVQFQDVTGAAAAQSHGAQSHGDGQQAESKGEKANEAGD